MSKASHLLVFFLLLSFFASNAQTRVEVDLPGHEKDRIPVKVYPPKGLKDWVYAAPEIVPGTYWKARYRLFFKGMKAVATDGSKMNISRKGSRFRIRGKGKELGYIEYLAEQTISNQGFRRFTSGCAGTVFGPEAFLLNFNAVNGYFEGFQDEPMEVTINHSEDHYGAGSLAVLSRGKERDVFQASSYDDLVDRPMMYSKPDTSSFKIKDNTFRISVVSEKDLVTSEMAQKRIKFLMHAMDSFCGFQRKEDYHFLFLLVDRDRMKGLFGKIGLGAALEHNNSSVYYWSDRNRGKDLKSMDNVVPHEYLHTITPLSLHSDRIVPFNFPDPNMSRHLWLYEGATDYFNSLMRPLYGLSGSLRNDLSYAIRFNEKGKARSMTKSGKNIIVKWVFDIPSKMRQVDNAYQRGKLIAFGLDVELIRLSEGRVRLLDVMIDMNNELKGKSFRDEDFKELLVKHSYPEIGEFYDRYVQGKEMIPYEDYFDMLGWDFIPKGTKLLSYGIDIYYDSREEYYFIFTDDENDLGLLQGDIIHEVNGIPVNEKTVKEGVLRTYNYPEPGESMKVLVEREGEMLSLTGKPTHEEKLKQSRVRVKREFTLDQAAFRRHFLQE